jgi:DNA-binding MarR family transcriptional regulator
MDEEGPAKGVDLVDFYRVLMRFIDQGGYALTIRQLVVFLTCYLLDEDHTVKRLAIRLRVSKPAISRILDYLVERGLIERKADSRDRRSILFEKTDAGRKFLEHIARPAPGGETKS